MKRVTISKHTTADTNFHFDIFWDSDADYLITYEIKEPNSIVSELTPIECKRKYNHRKIYLDYEGEVSKGRGSVEIIWKGFNYSGDLPLSENILIELEDNKIIFRDIYNS